MSRFFDIINILASCATTGLMIAGLIKAYPKQDFELNWFLSSVAVLGLISSVGMVIILSKEIKR